MLRSMTGFGTAQGSVEGVEYAVEVRSVNSRYLKPVIRLPEGLSSLEADVEKAVRERISRGTVTVNVRMHVPEELATYTVNALALQRYIDQLKPLEIDASPMLRIDLGVLLQLPGVCEPPALEAIAGRTRDGLLAIIVEALEALIAMRQVEGEAQGADLAQYCEAMASDLSAVSQRAPAVVADYRQRLAARVAELLNAGSAAVDEDALAREVAVFAERSDIAEEVSRLTGHLAQFRETMAAEQPAGRKLDFIAQEMLREANTIASKANDAGIARRVVDIKTAIDRIKEQVQNVE